MIIDMILIVLQNVLNILLLPLSAINIAVDFVSSFTVVEKFLQVILYILPWNNLIPLIVLTIALIAFRISISVIKTIINVIPFA